MKIWIQKRAGLAVLAVWLSVAQAEEAGPTATEVPFEEVRAGSFRLVAPDAESAATVRTMAIELSAMVDRFIERPYERMPLIDLRLAPPGFGNIDARVRFYEGRVGDYGLVLRWDENTAMAELAERLVEVYLRQIVFTQADRNVAGQVPDWLISAFGLRLQTRMRPGLRLYLQEITRGLEVPSLQAVIGMGNLDTYTIEDRLRHFWLLEMLNRLMTGERRRKNFFGAILLGANPLEQLMLEVPQLQQNPDLLETWWVVGLQEEIWRMTGPNEAIARSLERLDRLWAFELLRDGQPFFPELEELWGMRQDDVVRGLAESKVQQIELRMGTVNPAASNAFLALGQALNALATGREGEFRRLLEAAREERALLRSIAGEVQAIREAWRPVATGEMQP